jgi:hypothetical protein
MSADPDRALLAASLAFAAAAVAGSAVAIRDELPGQPCGISVPLSVPAGLLAAGEPVLPHRGRCLSRRSSRRQGPSAPDQAR